MMNRNLCIGAFAVGLLMVIWIAAGYVLTNPLALVMTLIIAGVYGLGALEMRRFHGATLTLATALESIPQHLTHLGDWLSRVHPSLQNAVRLRVEGERVALPGPALTPYLVGLLVMLGMLGTFLGMVVTLNGAVIALESTTDLSAIRASLASPIKGLGLAFGTSVAGVAASAMLGLISSLCRRERQQISQVLETKIATELRGFSFAHQRQETFQALLLQSQALPNVVGKLEAMMTLMAEQQQQLNEGLLAGQQRFFQETQVAYGDLARSVDQSLKGSLTESARIAGDTLKPLVASTMTGLAQTAESFQQGLSDRVKQQLEGLSSRFDTTVAQVESSLTTALARQGGSSEQLVSGLKQSMIDFAKTFEQGSATLLNNLQTELVQRDEQRLAALGHSLEGMATSLQREWQLAGAETLAQQQKICATLEQTAQDISAQAASHARDTIQEIAQLMQAASEAPRAAAEVIGQLRQEISNSIGRDNELLEERSRIMAILNQLLEAINHAASEQRGIIDTLVASSTALLDRVGSRFSEQVGAETSRLADIATQVNSSAIEVSSLGETLGFAVQQMGEANGKLIANLQGIEASLEKSMARSDDQLAYYVAQARELIDLSIMSQQQIVADIQQISGRQRLLAVEAN
ncbi:MAG TPA: DUF802 domain-containing protein [Rhodocyclaceae bacterium]|jgi:hypothetical protein